MSLEQKEFPFDVKEIKEDGTFTGYGAVFGNVDQVRDVITKGAFTKTIKERKAPVKMLWQHDRAKPIGVFETVREDETGLYVEGKLALGTQQGKEAYELLKMGALSGLSIGYYVIKDEIDHKERVRHLKELKLDEISVVTFPCNEEANVLSVKSVFDQLTNEQVHELAQLLIKSLDKDEEPEAANDDQYGDDHLDVCQADTKDLEPQELEELKHSIEQIYKSLHN